MTELTRKDKIIANLVILASLLLLCGGIGLLTGAIERTFG